MNAYKLEGMINQFFKYKAYIANFNIIVFKHRQCF